MNLQRKYNAGENRVVFCTYQMYLRGMVQRVHRDLARSKAEGWHFAAKVVRGAYMVSERQKASARGVESPVCATYEETEENYHEGLLAILRHNLGASPPAAAALPGAGPAEVNRAELITIFKKKNGTGFRPLFSRTFIANVYNKLTNFNQN